MKTIKDLLEAVKATKGISTKYALAKALNLPTQRISDYYNGKTYPDNDACLEIARALNIDLEEVITIVQIESAKDETRREKWREYYKSIGGYAASIALFFLAVTFIVTPTPAEASIGKASTTEDFVLCKVRTLIRTLAAIAQRTISTFAPRCCFSG